VFGVWTENDFHFVVDFRGGFGFLEFYLYLFDFIFFRNLWIYDFARF